MSTQELQNGNPLVFVTIHPMRNKGPKSRHFTGEFKKISWTSNSNGLFKVEGVRGYVGQPERIRGERYNMGHKRIIRGQEIREKKNLVMYDCV